MDIQEYLEAHPLPWRLDSNGGDSFVAIYDANDNRIDFALNPRFAECVAELANIYANTSEIIGRKNVLLGEAAGKIDELRKERDDARRAATEWNIQRVAAVDDAADLRGAVGVLRDLIGAQRELIDHLQNHIRRLEARS